MAQAVIYLFNLVRKLFLLNAFIQVLRYSKISSNLIYFQFRKDFDIERSKETEEYENSPSLAGSNIKSCSNTEAKLVVLLQHGL